MSYLGPSPARQGRARGHGRAMGDDAAPVSPIAALVAQVNRFGPSAPAAFQFAAQPFVEGRLDLALALTALTIYLRRSTDAYAQFHDAGTAATIEAANAGFADPVAFVNAHLGDMLPVIRAFADSLGLAAAPGTQGGAGISTEALVIAGSVLGLWWLLEKRP